MLVGEVGDWRAELVALLGSQGYSTQHVSGLEAALPLLAGDGVQALFLAAGPLAASDLILLRRIRQSSPQTSVVVVTMTPTDPDLKRAFESGATAFLSWPASSEAVRRAVDPRARLASGGSRP